MTTLNTYLPLLRLGEAIRHDDFVRASAQEFDAVYSGRGKRMETREVSEGRVHESRVTDGARELKSWEWQYGQTPEFTNDIEGEVSIGRVVSRRKGVPGSASLVSILNDTPRSHNIVVHQACRFSQPTQARLPRRSCLGSHRQTVRDPRWSGVTT